MSQLHCAHSDRIQSPSVHSGNRYSVERYSVERHSRGDASRGISRGIAEDLGDREAVSRAQAFLPMTTFLLCLIVSTSPVNAAGISASPDVELASSDIVSPQLSEPVPAARRGNSMPTTQTEAAEEKAVSGMPVWEGFARSSVTLYLADTRTMGGVGGGVGVRYYPKPWLYVQGDFAARMMIGSVGEARVAVGVQRAGFCSPSVDVFVSSMFGDQLSFFLPDMPAPTLGPAIALGAEVHPLRFRKGGLMASALNVGLGVGLESGVSAFELQIGILEVGMRF